VGVRTGVDVGVAVGVGVGVRTGVEVGVALGVGVGVRIGVGVGVGTGVGVGVEAETVRCNNPPLLNPLGRLNVLLPATALYVPVCVTDPVAGFIHSNLKDCPGRVTENEPFAG
jgi:hypothetical protein